MFWTCLNYLCDITLAFETLGSDAKGPTDTKDWAPDEQEEAVVWKQLGATPKLFKGLQPALNQFRASRRFYRSLFLIGMKQRKLSESLFLIEYITRYHKISQDTTRYHKISQDITRYHKISQVIAFCFCLRALDRIRYAFPLTRSNSNSTSCVPNGDWEYGAAPQAARRTWVLYEFKLICVICDGSSWCAATWHNV